MSATERTRMQVRSLLELARASTTGLDNAADLLDLWLEEEWTRGREDGLRDGGRWATGGGS